MSKVAKLVMVTSNNNNKFYTMTDNDNGTFTVEYGRVGANPQTSTYSISQWNKKYNEKVKKGYTDNTDLFIVEEVQSDNTDNNKTVAQKVVDFAVTRSKVVINIVKKLQAWANKSISENYTVSSEDVTQKQVDKAQEVLDQIVSFDLTKDTINDFNKLLLQFYAIVPRKMKHVKNHLINVDDNDLIERKNKIISEEQDTLDVMAGQVKLNNDTKTTEDSETNTEQQSIKDLISSSGLEIEEVTDTAVISTIKSMMQNNSNKFKEAFQVTNIETQKRFNDFVNSAKNNKTELFWHGSRNENWWSILTSGLRIRPSNAASIQGAMFGNSVYFANKFQKSYGYTSGRNSYWARGNSNEAVLAIYDVHVGNQKHIYKHDSSCYSLSYDKIQKDGFDSVYAHGGIDLRNDEFMIYNTDQSTIKYLVLIDA